MLLSLYFEIPQAPAFSKAQFQKCNSVEHQLYQSWSCEINCFFPSLSARGVPHSRAWIQLRTEGNKDTTRMHNMQTLKEKLGKNVQTLEGMKKHSR